MNDSIRMTVPKASVGADAGQPSNKNNNKSISNLEQQSNQHVSQKLGVSGAEALQTVTLTEIYDTPYLPKMPVIDGLLYNGTYLFAGAPKIGKSFLMMQIGFHVSTGLSLWGNKVSKGTVLYLALEDDMPRIQRRVSKMFGIESNDRLHFAIQSKTMNEGLEWQLNHFVEMHADARLIIIDTLQKVREVSGDKSGYSSDYDVVGKLKAFSDKHGICLLVVHHTRKMEAADSFEMISGTNGLLGAADGAFIVQKEKRTDNKAIMEIAGRDQTDQKLHLNFNREQCVWEMVKSETELWKEPPDPILESIAGLLSVNQKEWSGSATKLLELLPGITMNPNVLTRKLNVCLEKLFHDYGIKYETCRSGQSRMIKLILAEPKADDI